MNPAATAQSQRLRMAVLEGRWRVADAAAAAAERKAARARRWLRVLMVAAPALAVLGAVLGRLGG